MDNTSSFYIAERISAYPFQSRSDSYPVQVAAVSEGVTADSRYVMSDRDLFQHGLSVKCPGPHRGHFISDPGIAHGGRDRGGTYITVCCSAAGHFIFALYPEDKVCSGNIGIFPPGVQRDVSGNPESLSGEITDACSVGTRIPADKEPGIAVGRVFYPDCTSGGVGSII